MTSIITGSISAASFLSDSPSASFRTPANTWNPLRSNAIAHDHPILRQICHQLDFILAQDRVGDLNRLERVNPQIRHQPVTLNGDVATDRLRAAYDDYCQRIGEKPLPAVTLGKRLAKRAIKKGRRPDGDRERIYSGVSLR